MSLFSYLPRAILALLVVLGLIASMVVANERARSGGIEVILQVEPIDPRDVFFGHYAILSYAEFGTSFADLEDFDIEGPLIGDVYYLGLDAGDIFSVRGTVFDTLDAAQASGTPFLKAIIEGYGGLQTGDPAGERGWLRLELPTQYYADEETALSIEDRFREAGRHQLVQNRLELCFEDDAPPPDWLRCELLDPNDANVPDIALTGVILSVSDTGEAVIKGLYLDGQFMYDSLTGPRLELERIEDAD